MCFLLVDNSWRSFVKSYCEVVGRIGKSFLNKNSFIQNTTYPQNNFFEFYKTIELYT
jgi:hypothetical protein